MYVSMNLYKNRRVKILFLRLDFDKLFSISKPSPLFGRLWMKRGLWVILYNDVIRLRGHSRAIYYAIDTHQGLHIADRYHWIERISTYTLTTMSQVFVLQLSETYRLSVLSVDVLMSLYRLLWFPTTEQLFMKKNDTAAPVKINNMVEHVLVPNCK